MSLLRCEICNGQLQKISADQFECVDCGALYSLEEARRIINNSSSSNNCASRQTTVKPKSAQPTVNYSAEVSLGRFKGSTTLRITNTLIQWKSKTYLVNTIDGIAFGITKKTTKIGHSTVYSGTDYTVELSAGNEIITINLDSESQYNKVIDIIWKLRYTAIISNILNTVSSGQKYCAGAGYLTDSGLECEIYVWNFFSKDEIKKEFLPWSEYGKSWKYEIEYNFETPTVFINKINGGYLHHGLIPCSGINARFIMIIMDLVEKYNLTRLSELVE